MDHSPISLVNYCADGSVLKACFDPTHGMNLTSFLWKEHEILDLSTRALFEQRCAGLGALIGPHFHHRQPSHIVRDFPMDLFPHLKRLSHDQLEPFSHGIARYVPWNYEASSTQVKAWIQGSDLHQGYPLKFFEGFDFSMRLDAILLSDGLLLDYTVEAQEPCVIGFHYYYPCYKDSWVEALVKPFQRDKTGWQGIKDSWFDTKTQKLQFCLNQEADLGFMPLQDINSSCNTIILKHHNHKTLISFTSLNEDESSWQLYHPKDASYVCIEPLSALNPFKPVTKKNRLQMKISSI